MRAAAVFEVDDGSVGRHLVAAHPEHRPQRTGERQEEPAIAADALGGLCHLRAGAVVAVVPALRRLGPAPGTHHRASSQPDLGGGLVDLRVAGGHVTGHQPQVVRQRRQQVAGAQVAGPDPLIPGHPLRGQQRLGPGYQHHLADRRMVGTGVTGHHDRPLPALIAGQVGEESVGGAGGIFVADAEVVTYRVVAAVLDDRRPRQLDCTSQDRRQFGRPLRRGRRSRLRGRSGRVVRCFHGPLILPHSCDAWPHRSPAHDHSHHG